MNEKPACRTASLRLRRRDGAGGLPSRKPFAAAAPFAPPANSAGTAPGASRDVRQPRPRDRAASRMHGSKPVSGNRRSRKTQYIDRLAGPSGTCGWFGSCPRPSASNLRPTRALPDRRIGLAVPAQAGPGTGIRTRVEPADRPAFRASVRLGAVRRRGRSRVRLPVRGAAARADGKARIGNACKSRRRFRIFGYPNSRPFAPSWRNAAAAARRAFSSSSCRRGRAR